MTVARRLNPGGNKSACNSGMCQDDDFRFEKLM